MPYLNWKTGSIRPVRQEVGEHPRREFQLSLSVSSEGLQDLVTSLEDVFLRQGAELRLDLPEEWIVFWKVREEESRLLMAHPQPNEWVATAALEASHGVRLVSRLKELKPGQSLQVSEGGTIGRVSNVEIVIALV